MDLVHSFLLSPPLPSFPPSSYYPPHSPLLYALSMVENFTVLESYAFHSKDYMVLPGTPWNYALLLTDDVMFDNELQYVGTGLQPNVPPFSQKGAPGMILAKVPPSISFPLPPSLDSVHRDLIGHKYQS